MLLGGDSAAIITTPLDNGSLRDSGVGWSPLSQEVRGVALVVWEGSTRPLPSAPALQLPPQSDRAADTGVTPAAAKAVPISTAGLEKPPGFLHPAVVHQHCALEMGICDAAEMEEVKKR